MVSLTISVYEQASNHTLPDRSLLDGASTFLDFQHSGPNSVSGSKTNPIDNRYYPSAHYIPHNFSGMTLWTPLLCFPLNTIPYVTVLMCLLIDLADYMIGQSFLVKSEDTVKALVEKT